MTARATTRGIDYTIAPCELGLLLVAASELGVCRVRFGDDADALTAALQSEFPYAPLRRDEVRIKPWRDALVATVDGHAKSLDVPLDVRASPFQRRVWDALRRIPRGETRFYGELAGEFGMRRGARAVARACANNPVPLLVPCHRVVPRDGSLGGYAFGVERKRALLRREEVEVPAGELAG